MGWMEATCFYNSQGFIPKMEAEVSIKLSLERIENSISLEQSKRAKKLLLMKNPYCSKIVP